jgi:CARDB.
MTGANRFLSYSLEFRRDGLAGIATELPTALGEQNRDAATARIARDMRDFLVSDVLVAQRVAPELRDGLADRDLAPESDLPGREFLPAVDWLEEKTISDRLGALREGPGEVGAGARGLALGVVTAGGETLNESAPTQVSAAPDLSFSLQVQNQGAVPEEQVEVSIAITGGATPLAVERTLESIPAGGSETATLPLAETPPTGRPVTVTIKVDSAEGEGRTDDNESSYPATFVPG